MISLYFHDLGDREKRDLAAANGLLAAAASRKIFPEESRMRKEEDGRCGWSLVASVVTQIT